MTTEWQSLHRRTTSGETLTETEQAVYETGCQEMDATDNLDGDLTRLQQLRASLLEVEAEHQQLRTQEHALDKRIAALEAQIHH